MMTTRRFAWKRLPQGRHVKHHRGFALVEALISILIFSFGVLGLLGLEARGIEFSVNAENRNRASLLASEIASSLWLAGTVATTAPQIAAWQNSANIALFPLTGLPNATVAVTPDAGLTNASGIVNAADIVITWQDPSRPTVDQLTTRVILP